MPTPSDFRPFSLANAIQSGQAIQSNALTIQGQQEGSANVYTNAIQSYATRPRKRIVFELTDQLGESDMTVDRTNDEK